MSFSTILSAVIEGLEVAFIHVEADISNGLPVFHMVGYLSSEVKEAGERVRTAIKNSGFEYPAKRTVVNLSPATMRKHGASFDLPIAAAILTALGQIEKPEKDCLIIGELSLGGSVKKVSGVLPIVMEAKEKGVRKCIVPSENVTEASLVSEMEIVGAATLQEAVEAMQNRRKRKKIQNKEITDCGNLRKTVQKETKFPDFADMKGQEFVKRAAEIAVAAVQFIKVEIFINFHTFSGLDMIKDEAFCNASDIQCVFYHDLFLLPFLINMNFKQCKN